MNRQRLRRDLRHAHLGEHDNPRSASRDEHELFKIDVELDWFEKHARGRKNGAG